MAIFGQYSGGMGSDFNVAGNMDAVLKGQQNIHDNMLAAVEKFNTARQDMEVLQKQTGAILSQYGVDEKGKPDDTAPKYVHDLFKNVNKEGGLANMSRSQMIAGLKAYETGVGVEKNQLDVAGAKENLRAKKLNDDILQMQYDEAVRVRGDQKRIKEAQAATEEARKALSNTKTGTTLNEVSVLHQGENIKLDTKEFRPLIEEIDAAEKAKDPVRLEAANRAAEKYIYSKSRVSQQTRTVHTAEKYDENTGEWISDENTYEEKNPYYREFKSAYDKVDAKEYNLSKGERPQESWMPPASIQGFLSKEKAKIQAEQKAAEEAKSISSKEDKSPIAVLRKKIENNKKELGPMYEKGVNLILPEIENLKNELSLGMSPYEFNAAVIRASQNIDKGLGVSVNVGGEGLSEEDFKKSPKGKALAKIREDWNAIVGEMRQKMDFGEHAPWGWTDSYMEWKDVLKGQEAAAPPSKLIKGGLLPKEGRDLNTGTVTPEQRIAAIEGVDKVIQAVKGKVEKTIKPTQPTEYQAGDFRTSYDQRGIEYRQEQTQVRKSVEEQLDDEFGIMQNYFKAHGGVPDSFTKDAFYKMRGINPPVNVDVGGGYQYVAFGGKEAIVKRAESNGMSVKDQRTMWEAGEFSKARNLNGLNVNGFRFSGEVRVGDIDKANTVKNELFTTTRALSSVDRMIEIAQDASLFDKLAPTQISGIATALTNAAQSANRTEIGGSGAWSNQDQAYMDKVITNPTGAFNAIFSTQTVAVLKEYRQRLLMGMHDKATVYGFAFERDGDSSGLDNQMSQFRVLYNSALHRGMSEQEALEYSKGQLYSNAQ
jgi:hypothetical protein